VRIHHAAVLTVAVLALAGCSTPTSVGDYFGDRLHDLADICNVEVGAGAGVFAELRVRRAVDLAVGYVGPATKWVGLIDGKLGAMTPADFSAGLPCPQLVVLYLLASNVLDNPFYIGSAPFDALVTGGETNGYIAPGLRGDRTCYLFIPELAGDEAKKADPLIRLLDLSAELSIVVRARATVSPGHLLDFIGGIFCLDMAGDDEPRLWLITPEDDPACKSELRDEPADSMDDSEAGSKAVRGP
jgi:hypothetical protein